MTEVINKKSLPFFIASIAISAFAGYQLAIYNQEQPAYPQTDNGVYEIVQTPGTSNAPNTTVPTEAPRSWQTQLLPNIDPASCQDQCQEKILGSLFNAKTGFEFPGLSMLDEGHILSLVEMLVQNPSELSDFQSNYIQYMSYEKEVAPELVAKVENIVEKLPSHIRAQIAQDALSNHQVDPALVFTIFPDATELKQEVVDTVIANISVANQNDVYLLQTITSGPNDDTPQGAQNRARALDAVSSQFLASEDTALKIAVLQSALYLADDPQKLEGLYEQAMISGEAKVTQAALDSAALAATNYYLRNPQARFNNEQPFSDNFKQQIATIVDDTTQPLSKRNAAMRFLIESGEQ